ncbi:MAG: tetratricopeptide repeat protein [Pyrinomonadaceae bacterium]|nr:tetratricopeptide repeat protein [Pyrinomonadaceae bacterium]
MEAGLKVPIPTGFSHCVKSLVSALFLATFCFSTFLVAGDDVQKLDLDDVRKQIKRAKKFSRRGESAAAETILRRVIASNPQNSEAKLELAYIFLKQKRLVDSYNYSFAVADKEPNNAYAFAILGATYLSAGNFSEARKLLQNAIILSKKVGLAWAAYGMLDFYENRIEESILNLREAVHRDSREPDFVFALAQVSARGERYKEAADAYERFLRIAPKTDKERRERIKGLTRFLRYLGKKSSLYKAGGEHSTVVKMDLVNNRPIIKLRLKKKGELLNFVLDTGSGISVVSIRAAKRLKIRGVARGGVARALGGDGKFEIVYGFLKRVYIGDVKVKNVPIYIREFHNRKERVDGYIGLSLISKFITTIDYGNSTFALQRKDKTQAPNFENDAMTIPLRLTSSGFLSGEVKLKGIRAPLNFIVDTGASVSVISEDLADSGELSPYVLQEKMRVIGAAGVTENVPSFLLPRVTFGRFSRSSLKAIALDLDLINETSGFEQAGILGGNFLRNYRLTFDFKRSKVTFVPNVKK